MPKQFLQNKPVTSFAIFTLVCAGLGLAVKQVEASIGQSHVEVSANNPHFLPDELNPKLNWVEQKLEAGEQKAKDVASEAIGEIKEEVAEEAQTIHAIAFKDNKSEAKPIYDYTTGTSN
jgi:hypothetical protein